MRAGWLSSCTWGSASGVATNEPDQGEQRVLDALVISPSLAGRWEDFPVTLVWGFSSRQIVTRLSSLSKKGHTDTRTRTDTHGHARTRADTREHA